MTPPPEPHGLTGSSNSHARLSPSSSKQWTQCVGSIAYAEANAHRIPEDNSSAYSNEGTEAHEWAAKLLLKEITEEEIPENFRPYVKAYVDFCLAQVPEDASYQVESQVPLFYQPESTGTTDFAIVSDDLVCITDLKFGAGVLVSAHENTQLAIYALSLIRSMEDIYDFHPATEIRLSVFQPRHREALDAKPWVTNLHDFEAFCQDIEYKAIQAHTGLEQVRAAGIITGENVSAAAIREASPRLTFIATEGDDGSCRWCKCKGFCEVRLAAATEGLSTPSLDARDLLALLPDLTKEEKKLDTVDRIDAAVVSVATDADATADAVTMLLSDEFLVTLLDRKAAITKFLNDVEEYLETRALAGTPAPGTKLVLSREGNRAWANSDEAEVFLRNQGLKEKERFTFTLKSPTQVEKILDIAKKPKRTQSRFEELISRSSARPVLALESDKRPSVSPSVDMLPGLDEEV